MPDLVDENAGRVAVEGSAGDVRAATNGEAEGNAFTTRYHHLIHWNTAIRANALRRLVFSEG